LSCTQHTNNNCEATDLPTISMKLSTDACSIFWVYFLLTKQLVEYQSNVYKFTLHEVRIFLLSSYLRNCNGSKYNYICSWKLHYLRRMIPQQGTKEKYALLSKIVEYHLYRETKQKLLVALMCLMCYSNAAAKWLQNAYNF